MDDGGNRTTSFVTEKFQAAPIEMNGATFTMSWDGDRKEMTVTPSTDDIRYFKAIFDSEHLHPHGRD